MVHIHANRTPNFITIQFSVNNFTIFHIDIIKIIWKIVHKLFGK